jgi:hypothetical protein
VCAFGAAGAALAWFDTNYENESIQG